MASIHKHPRSPYWMAHFTGKNGTRHTKSTKLEAKPKKANRQFHYIGMQTKNR